MKKLMTLMMALMMLALTACGGSSENSNTADADLQSFYDSLAEEFQWDEGYLVDIEGEMLVVSNFTLLASYRKGNRPDYMNSAPPAEAKRLYDFFISYVKESVPHVGEGIFGADMKVSITNDGPVTIPMDSNVLKQPKSKS